MRDDAYSIFIDFLIPWEVSCQGWDAFERILCEIKLTEYNARKRRYTLWKCTITTV